MEENNTITNFLKSPSRRKFLSTAGAAVTATSLAGCTGGSDQNFVSLATGSTGGSWFPIGGALADLWSNELDMTVTAESTGGAVDNIRLINNDEADLGIVFANTALEAVDGSGDFDDPKDIQAVFGLFQAHTHLVSLDEANVESIDDLVGLDIGTGTPGSGTNQVATSMLEYFDLADDVNGSALDLQEQADSMRDGQLDAAFWSNPIPSPSIEELGTERDISIFDFSDEIDVMTDDIDFITEARIPAETYPDQENDIINPGISNFLFVPADADEDIVYDMVTTTFENLDSIQDAHPAISEFEDSARAVTIDFHPAAEEALDDLGF